jgi:hypothetical protein
MQLPYQSPAPIRYCPGLCVLLLALVHSTTFAAEKWLDEFNVVDIASGYSDSRPNKSISDKPLSVGGVVFKRGVGTHAPSSGSFMTDGKSPLRFTAKAGADDAADSGGSVVFQVVGDDKKLFDSGLMRKGDPAKDVDVDLTGHKQIELRITAELPAGGFACITEANIFDYSGMTIGPRGRILTGIFEDDTKGWNLAGNIATPWRIVIAVDT